jgi:hypothetical protein
MPPAKKKRGGGGGSGGETQLSGGDSYGSNNDREWRREVRQVSPPPHHAPPPQHAPPQFHRNSSFGGVGSVSPGMEVPALIQQRQQQHQHQQLREMTDGVWANSQQQQQQHALSPAGVHGGGLPATLSYGGFLAAFLDFDGGGGIENAPHLMSQQHQQHPAGAPDNDFLANAFNIFTAKLPVDPEVGLALFTTLKSCRAVQTKCSYRSTELQPTHVDTAVVILQLNTN